MTAPDPDRALVALLREAVGEVPEDAVDRVVRLGSGGAGEPWWQQLPHPGEGPLP